jgi:hypothetical protein
MSEANVTVSDSQIRNVVSNLSLEKRLREHVGRRTAHNSTEDPAFFVEALVLELLIDFKILESNLEDEVSSQVESALEDAGINKKALADFVEESELDRAIETWCQDNEVLFKDSDEYVTQDELADKVEEVIGELDITKDVAAGAAAGAMGRVDRMAAEYERKLDSLVQHYESQLQDIRSDLGRFHRTRLTFWSRLRFVLTGKLAGER